jgi:hypothetical protein
MELAFLSDLAIAARSAPEAATGRPLQHPASTAREGPVLLAVDQRLGGGAALWVAPELADPVGVI